MFLLRFRYRFSARLHCHAEESARGEGEGGVNGLPTQLSTSMVMRERSGSASLFPPTTHCFTTAQAPVRLINCAGWIIWTQTPTPIPLHTHIHTRPPAHTHTHTGTPIRTKVCSKPFPPLPAIHRTQATAEHRRGRRDVQTSAQREGQASVPEGHLADDGTHTHARARALARTHTPTLSFPIHTGLKRLRSTEEDVETSKLQLRERLKPLFLKEVALPNDGNCQFRAFSQQLYGTQVCACVWVGGWVGGWGCARVWVGG